MTEFIPAAKPLIGDEERAAVDRVLLSGMVAQGPEVAAFEREFADHFVERLPVIAVNSGTSGLHLGLLAAGVGPGDEVIVPSFTFAATGNSVALTVLPDGPGDFWAVRPGDEVADLARLGAAAAETLARAVAIGVHAATRLPCLDLPAWREL